MSAWMRAQEPGRGRVPVIDEEEGQTMISDDERRRAVAELREASTGAYRHVDALDVIAGSVGVDADGKFDHDIEKETYAALADLIDRPTCRICATDHEYEDSVRCDRCLMKFRRPWEPFKYCPNCGAEVVSADD